MSQVRKSNPSEIEENSSMATPMDTTTGARAPVSDAEIPKIAPVAAKLALLMWNAFIVITWPQLRASDHAAALRAEVRSSASNSRRRESVLIGCDGSPRGLWVGWCCMLP